jgi:4-amino-4-deoxy-L-arabinose transferase-like glycosyltransferase
MDAASPSDRLPAGWLAAAAIAGLAARLAFGLLYWTHQPLTRDELEYLSLARSLAAGHGFVYDEVLRSGSFVPFGRAPGYPAFIALVGAGHAVTTSVPVALKIAQACVGALGVWIAGVLAHRLAGARASRAAAGLAAVYPPLVWIAGYAWSEAIFWPVGLLVAWLFDRALAQPTRASLAILCGLATGAGLLIRPGLLLFLPVAGVYLLIRGRGRTLVALGLGVALVVVPWTIRNYVHHGRLMIVASDGGVNFWIGNHPLAIGDGDMAANVAIKQDNVRLRADHPGLTEEQMEPIYYREAFVWIAAHPLAWLALEARKAFYLVVPIGPSYTLHSARYLVTSVAAYGVVLALAIAGAMSLGGRVGRTPGLWVLAASAVLTCLVFFSHERFRIPIVDPALVVLGGAGLAALLDRARRARA